MSDTHVVDLLRGLAVLAEPPEEGHDRVVRALGLGTVPTPADYADLFVFQLYPYASVHLGSEGMLGGEARDRVAGFWRALGYTPPAEPDHLAALLGLYAALIERERDAGEVPDAAHERALDPRRESPAARRGLLAQARTALLGEHLAPWVFHYLGRVSELAPATYGPWARVTEELLRAEVERCGGAASLGLSAHLREAPALADPRVEGAGPFLDGLLAPARAGFIVTRADLARIAVEADVGLRAGERRYALEHLLAQGAPAVLRGLAAEAERQGGAHRDREPWIGASAAFLRDRCASSAALLRDLAEAAVTEAMAS